MVESGATALFHQSEFAPYARRRDDEVAARIRSDLHVSHGGLVHPPGTVLTAKGALSQVFTPFHREWQRVTVDPWPEGGDAELMVLPSEGVPKPGAAPVMTPGTDGAWERLVGWLDRVDDYVDRRDVPSVDGTSELFSVAMTLA